MSGETPVGARLHLPRDLQLAYLVGRFGVVTPYDVWPVLHGSLTAARWGFLRLTRLGILRACARPDPTKPTWYGLTERGHAWVVGEVGCPDDELRVVTGIRRANLPAWSARNELWASAIVACRADAGTRLALVRPEWELRRMRTPEVRVVPDMLVVLAAATEPADTFGWMVELDAGTERLGVWSTKIRDYLAVAALSLYGIGRWAVLGVMPSARRAASVARTAVDAGGGELLYCAVAGDLADGRALAPVVWRAADLVAVPRGAPTSLAALLVDSGQRPRAAAARADAPASGGVA